MTIRPSSSLLRVAVVMTVFNRREATLRCLHSVAGQLQELADFTVFVVDDSSTDGTSEAVAEKFPETRMLRGNGQLYWNGGMRVGLKEAYEGDFDYYWWLNDDVELDSDAFERLAATADSQARQYSHPGIVVGSLRDPGDGRLTYGGVSRIHPLRRIAFSLVDPGEEPISVETMNGNCVLVPNQIATGIGNLSPEYRQKMGDFDYGLRARQAGFQVWVAPGTFGTCAQNEPGGNKAGSLGDELSELWSVTELPFGPWKSFCRRWSGPLWPAYFLSPYAKRGFRIVAERLRGRSE